MGRAIARELARAAKNDRAAATGRAGPGPTPGSLMGPPMGGHPASQRSPHLSDEQIADAVAAAQEQAILKACSEFPGGFRYFLPWWRFLNRETGREVSFAQLWPGQMALSEVMCESPWIFALKAGKLGFSELECAWDGYVARFGGPNARVHMFSYMGDSAREIFGWVRYGLEHLPEWMRLPMLTDEAGGDTSRSIKLQAGEGDVRRVVAYATSKNISIDQTCTHAHLDEFARWPVQDMWAAIQSTVAPGGSCHIVTRGAGPNFAAQVYEMAKRGKLVSLSGEKMVTYFAPWTERPRPEGWFEAQVESFGPAKIKQFAPQTDREALQGDDSYVYPQYENPPGRHVVPAHPCELWECERIGVGIDPGAVNPTAMVLVGERTSGRRHVYDEFYMPGAGLDDIEACLIEWWIRARKPYGGKMQVAVPGDEKTMGATLQRHLGRYGIAVMPAIREIATGIGVVGRYLNDNALTVYAGCVNVDNEFRDYRNTSAVDKVTRVEYAGDRPIKHHADAMDALRYDMMLLSTWREVRGQPVRLAGGMVVRGR